MDIHRGVLCGMTEQKPEFESLCPDFEQDSEYRDVVVTDRIPQSDGTISVAASAYDKMVEAQNFPLAVIAGIVVGVLCSLIWAIFTVVSGTQLGFFALAVGVAVGFTIRYAGKGVVNKFGILGGIIAVLSCVVGNIFSSIGFIALETGLSFWQALIHFDYGMLPLLMKETFHPMDLLFYAFACIEGYKFAFRKIGIK
jgi:hypothetical protein